MSSLELSKELSCTHSEALNRVKESLKANGWGVLAQLDLKTIFKEKLGVDIESYDILDVCNPKLANEALKLNKSMGLVLPCKMVVYLDENKTIVSLYLPTEQMPSKIERYSELIKVAEQAEASLRAAFEAV